MFSSLLSGILPSRPNQSEPICYNPLEAGLKDLQAPLYSPLANGLPRLRQDVVQITATRPAPKVLKIQTPRPVPPLSLASLDDKNLKLPRNLSNLAQEVDKIYKSIRFPAKPYQLNVSSEHDLFGNPKYQQLLDMTALDEGFLMPDGNFVHFYPLPPDTKEELSPKLNAVISLNVQPDARLIQSLFNWANQNAQHITEFKYSQNQEVWAKRHDPITIYHDDNLSDQAKQDLATLCKDFKRRSPNGQEKLFGKRIADGIYNTPYGTPENRAKLGERLEKMDLPARYQEKLNHVLSRELSGGEMEAFNRLLTQLEQEFQLDSDRS